MSNYSPTPGAGNVGAGCLGSLLRNPRILIALVIIGFSVFSFLGSSQFNPVTGKKQRVGLSPDQEIQLGLQAAPEMAQQHGGLHPDGNAQRIVDEVGWRIVKSNPEILQTYPWKFEFSLLADPQTVNAFALPGGQVFITMALYQHLNEAQLAGVFGHEIGHVVARHGAQRMAKQQLTQGVLGGVIAASGSASQAQMAQMVAGVIGLKYDREDELESDHLGVRFMAKAGYDPREMINVMKILAETAGAGGRQPEFFSTHPNPENRIELIQEQIDKTFPERFPEGLASGGPKLIELGQQRLSRPRIGDQQIRNF